MTRRVTPCWGAILFALIFTVQGWAQDVDSVPVREVHSNRSLANPTIEWPSWHRVQQVLRLEDYNVRIVILGTTMLGFAAGMVGSFTLLRKRALMGDALAHSTLPGIVAAYMIVTALGGDGKTMPVLLIGATISGLFGVGLILAIGRWTRLKEDTALGAVLSVFFGAGVAMLSVSTQMKEGNAAGLESFIYGKTASMGFADTQLIAVSAAICIVISLLLFKELKLLCFDDGYAGARGFPIARLDIILMSLVVVVTIVGLQAVGLILMIALLIIPAASARFWTEKLERMFVIAGVIGAASGWLGAGTSALFSKLPSGAMIVLVCTALFVLSMVFGSARGLLMRARTHLRLNRSVDRQHVLRAMYELMESNSRESTPKSSDASSVSLKQLLTKRSWSETRLLREVRRAQRDGMITFVRGRLQLTPRGSAEAARLTRQHRLWELYLIHFAEVAPTRVDRNADAIEHVLEPEVVDALQLLLDNEQTPVPSSPHELNLESAAAGSRAM